jgi:hypothetical protein
MHIDIVPNRNSTASVPLRESYHVSNQVEKHTLANRSALSARQVDTIRAVLCGEDVRPVGDLVEVIGSRAQGAVHAVAVAVAMRRLEFAGLLAA